MKDIEIRDIEEEVNGEVVTKQYIVHIVQPLTDTLM